MNVGIVGSGSMGTLHAKSWRANNIAIHTIYSHNEVSARKLAESHGISLSSTLEELIDNVDIVDICTPTDTHAKIVLSAAKKGKHILCEKPLARSVDEGKQMILACKKYKVRMMIAHVLRFFPEYRNAYEMTRSMKHGRAAVIRLYRHCFAPRTEQDNWFLDQKRSGGVLFDLMVHDIDFAAWTAGPVCEVCAIQVDKLTRHAVALLKHRSGCITHIEGSWAYPPPTFKSGFEIAFENTLLRYDSEDTHAFRVFNTGKKGSTVSLAENNEGMANDDSMANDDGATNSDGATIDESATNSDGATIGEGMANDDGMANNEGAVPLVANTAPYTEEIASFYQALEQNLDFPIKNQEALHVLQIASALHRSIETKEIQKIQDLPYYE